MEHRWGHRHEINRPVHLGTRGGVMARGCISNVSISGAFIVSPLPVALFSYIQVQFTAMLDGRSTVTAVEGQVVRKDGAGFGVEWREFAPEAVRSLVMAPPVHEAELAGPDWKQAGARRSHASSRSPKRRVGNLHAQEQADAAASPDTGEEMQPVRRLAP